MPDISGATVFDDLPESIITKEIFLRLPSRDVLRCGAVSKSWRGATSTEEFLHDHHQRQPLLPLVIFEQEDSVDAFDIREAPAKRRPVLKYKICDKGYGSTLSIHASCDGLLLLYLLDGRFSIVNPATGQWLALPRLTGVYRRIAGMYPHPHRSGEYNILFWRSESTNRNAGYYYILTVGSKRQNQKPRRIAPLLDPGALCSPVVLLNGCLHWVWRDGIMVFDTMEETFRSMSTPAAAGAVGTKSLLQMEGTLGLRCLNNQGTVMQIWVLQDYERDTWSKFESELPMVTFCSNALLSHKRDVLIYSTSTCLHQLHYDDNGKVLDKFQWETDCPKITEHWFKESLIRHTFFPRRDNGHVSPPRFFRRL